MSGLIWLYIGIEVLILIVALIFERGRYKPKISDSEGWEMTDEKFQDPTTGKWVQVRFNKRTGERDYVEYHEK